MTDQKQYKDPDSIPDNRPGERCINCGGDWYSGHPGHCGWRCMKEGFYKFAPTCRSELPFEQQYCVPSMLKMAQTKDLELGQHALMYVDDDGGLSKTPTDKMIEVVVIGSDANRLHNKGDCQIGFVRSICGVKPRDNHFDSPVDRWYASFNNYLPNAGDYPFKSLNGSYECLMLPKKASTSDNANKTEDAIDVATVKENTMTIKLSDCKFGDRVRIFVGGRMNHVVPSWHATHTIEALVFGQPNGFVKLIVPRNTYCHECVVAIGDMDEIFIPDYQECILLSASEGKQPYQPKVVKTTDMPSVQSKDEKTNEDRTNDMRIDLSSELQVKGKPITSDKLRQLAVSYTPQESEPTEVIATQMEATTKDIATSLAPLAIGIGTAVGAILSCCNIKKPTRVETEITNDIEELDDQSLDKTISQG